MTELNLSIGEPFTSPAWGSNFVVFAGGETIPEDDSKDYMRRVCKYAKHYGVYLVPERFLLMGYRCLCLISPDGRVLGAQKALYINTNNRIGKRSSTLEVLATEFGGVLLCVDVDIYHPEVARIAEGMGAQYLICSQDIADREYSSSMVLTGPWNAAQACNLYVIDACNQFNCVCAPLPLTKHEDGFVTAPSLKTPMTAHLNAEDLRRLRLPYRLSRKFYAIHRSDLLR